MTKKILSTLIFVLLVSSFVYAQENLVIPYILRAPEPITVDGVLDEWDFAFPLDHNPHTVPENGRFKAENPAWYIDDPYDCSGTLYMMYDDNYFYFAASVRDDFPGHFSDATWAADAIEFYMGNWDVGDALHSEDMGGQQNDGNTGNYSLQFGIVFSASLDSVRINCYGGYESELRSDETKAVYKLWYDEDGYNIEGQIFLDDVISPTTGNFFEFVPGTRIPMTWSLYDIDESESSADFQGFAYTPSGYAGWQGPGPGWQVCDVLETPRGFAWDESADFDFVAPYIKRVHKPVVIDGELDEWNFCFPLAHNPNTVPENGRFKAENPAWYIDDPYDCSGTLYMMYDEYNFYFAASVRDDFPGHFSDATWAADAIEYYLGNWDIGDALHSEDMGGQQNDGTSGNYSVQFGIVFSALLDSVRINCYGGYESELRSEETRAVYKLWDYEDGYNLEGKIALDDIISPTTGNFIEFVEGTRIPMTWSLYDIDESESSADFQGFAYTPSGYAGWQGPGPGWQYADVKGISSIEYIDIETSVEKTHTTAPKSFRLSNYPNPFNPTTNIQFDLDTSGEISLKIYNVQGQLVQTVIDNQTRLAGVHRVNVDLSKLPSAVYLAVLEQANRTLSHKMLLIK